MSHRIIFVGGVHGVGKSTLCRKICNEISVVHRSASDLISRITKNKFPLNKCIEGLESNQDILILAIDRYLDTEQYYLLDGHFCLLDRHGEVNDVAISTFIAMSPIAIVLLYDDPAKICARIKNRDNEMCDVQFISKYQDREIALAQKVADALKVPIIKANPFLEKDTLCDMICRLTDKRSSG